MNSPCSSDVSLYELATSADPQPQPLQISPTTLKSLVSVFVELVIEQQIPATLWMKLPRGEVWQAEIERFCQSATAPYSLFNLQTYPESLASDRTEPESTSSKPRNLLTQPHASSLEAASLEENHLPREEEEEAAEAEAIAASQPLVQTHSKVYNLPLAADSQLKREYFLLVIAPEFHGLVLAHRPRSMRSRTDAGTKETAANLNPTAEETLEQKHPLLGLCSFDDGLIQRVLDGINQAICCGQPTIESSDELQVLLKTWEDLVAQGQANTLNPIQFGNLLTKQIQKQEEIWRNGATLRRQAEQATLLRQENEDLLSAIRSKDEFVKIMGQELRTPLTSMKTALTLLNSPHLKPQQRQRYMDMISQECDRQSSLITSVLDLVQLESAVEQTPMEPIRLTDLVPGVVSTYQPLAQEKGLMLGYTIPEDLPPVSSVTGWLRQIVINLLHNSIKFTPTGGQVWVRAKQQGKVIQIEFRDTGIGIAQSDLPKIFDRFYRARGTGEDSSGAGLGLSIVQQLLLRCGGSIAVKSKLSEGSIFTVSLPIYSDSATGSHPQIAKSEE